MIGARRRVWVNLQRGDLSIGDPTSGRVLASVHDVTMVDVEFRASRKGWERIQRLGKRKPVSYAVGTVVDVDSKPDVDGCVCVTYNPWRRWDFHTLDGRSVTAADRVIFTDGHAYLMGDNHHA